MIKKRWLLVVLISSVQLALLLIGVMYGCAWLQDSLKQIVQRQASAANRHLLEDADARLSQLGLETDKLASSPAVRQMFESEFNLEESVVALYENGQLVVSNDLNLPAELDSIQAGGAELESRYWLSKKSLDDRFTLVAGQEQASYLGSIWKLTSILRNVGFGLTLLVGLVSTSLMVSVLQRYDHSLNKDREQLQAVLDEHSLSLMRTKNAIIFGLAKIAESRDTDTGEHLDRIGKYVTLLADRLRKVYKDIDDVFIADLALASSLHDIGKVGIPDSILLKPGRLTSDERFVMEQHTVIGGECLEAIEKQLGEDSFLEMARNIAYAHHERWDGKGYPYRLTNENIPLPARITSVADVYDALTTKRPYKKAMSHEESREIIVSGRGTQFDPAVVDAFLAAEEDFQAVAANQSDNQIPALLSLENIVAIQASSIQSPSQMA